MTKTIRITPVDDVPLQSADIEFKNIMQTTTAAVETAKLLGLDTTPTLEDRDTAATLAAVYAASPDRTNKKATVKNMAALRPATLALTDTILKNYAHSVVESAGQIRHLVTNKLIQETENPDPRIRLRALELLGKISDVGLFAEKTEITVTHQTTDDIRDRLKHKLMKLVMPQDNTEDAVVLDAKAVNLTDEIGLPGDSDD
jgi:hypothetical protein